MLIGSNSIVVLVRPLRARVRNRGDDRVEDRYRVFCGDGENALSKGLGRCELEYALGGSELWKEDLNLRSSSSPGKSEAVINSGSSKSSLKTNVISEKELLFLLAGSGTSI